MHASLQSKLESLAAQQGTQQGASAKGVSAIAWRGNTSVVAAERVRTTLATALDLSKQVPPSYIYILSCCNM